MVLAFESRVIVYRWQVLMATDLNDFGVINIIVDHPLHHESPGPMIGYFKLSCNGSGSGSTLGAWNAPAWFCRWVPQCGHLIRSSSPNLWTVSIVVAFPVMILCIYCVSNCIRRPHNIWRCHTGILPSGCTVLVHCFVYFCTFSDVNFCIPCCIVRVHTFGFDMCGVACHRKCGMWMI